MLKVPATPDVASFRTCFRHYATSLVGQPSQRLANGSHIIYAFDRANLVHIEQVLAASVAQSRMPAYWLCIFADHAMQAEWMVPNGQTPTWNFKYVANFKLGKQCFHAFDFAEEKHATLTAEVFDTGFGETIKAFLSASQSLETDPPGLGEVKGGEDAGIR